MLIVLLLAAAQAVSSPPVSQAVTPELTALVHQQFDAGCTPAPVTPHSAMAKDRQPIVVVTGDLDGDGDEDVVIVAQCPDLIPGAEEHNYRVLDPYNAYFGWGNPKDTRRFSSTDPEGDRKLLIIHGWRLPQPKAKFVIINLPFDRLAISRMTYKKKARNAIRATESGILNHYLVWDGKKYKWEPGEED